MNSDLDHLVKQLQQLEAERDLFERRWLNSCELRDILHYENTMLRKRIKELKEEQSPFVEPKEEPPSQKQVQDSGDPWKEVE